MILQSPSPVMWFSIAMKLSSLLKDTRYNQYGELTDLKKKVFGNLKPWETVEVARHPDRPMTTDYIELIFDEFVELHGDRCFGDDRAIRTDERPRVFEFVQVSNVPVPPQRVLDCACGGIAHPGPLNAPSRIDPSGSTKRRAWTATGIRSSGRITAPSSTSRRCGTTSRPSGRASAPR